MSDNYSCHGCSTAVAILGQVSDVIFGQLQLLPCRTHYSYHDLENFKSCHLLTLDSCHVALKNMAKNMLRVKRELPSAYKHARTVAMYPAKHMATDGFWRVGQETGMWVTVVSLEVATY